MGVAGQVRVSPCRLSSHHILQRIAKSNGATNICVWRCMGLSLSGDKSVIPKGQRDLGEHQKSILP